MTAPTFSLTVYMRLLSLWLHEGLHLYAKILQTRANRRQLAELNRTLLIWRPSSTYHISRWFGAWIHCLLIICFWLPSTQLFQVGWALLEERAWYCGQGRALAFESRRLGLGAMDLDFTMKIDFAHPTSQKRGDTDLYWCYTLCYGYCRWGLEGPMECWQDCVWELYPYTGRGWKVQQAWEQLCCCRVMPFFLSSFVLGCFGGHRVLALRRRYFCALWLFWNFDSMMLFVNVRA